MAALTLAFDVLARDRGASATLDKVGNAADRTGKKGGELGAKMKAGMAVAGVAVAGLAKASISAASNQNEALTKSNVVFGESAKAVENFASSAAKNLGLSKTAALDATGTFGNLFVALGIGAKPASDLSINLTKLGADLASFNNTSVDDALLALKSGLLGEAEPLRAFGVSLSAARIEAEALATGLVKPLANTTKVASATIGLKEAMDKSREATKKHGKTSLEAQKATIGVTKAEEALAAATKGVVPPLNAAQKAQAAYSIIQKDTATAHGDVARSQDTLAFKQKQLNAQFVDAKASLGTALLPVVLKAISAFQSLIKFVSKNQAVLKPLVVVVGAAAAAYFLVNKAMKVGMAVKAAYLALTGAQAAATVGATGAQVGLNAALLANPIGLVVVAIAALAAGLIYAYKNSETFRNIVQGAFKAIGTAASFMWNSVIKPVFKLWINAWFGVIGALVNGAAKAFGWVPGIGGKLKKAAAEFNAFRDRANAALDGVRDQEVRIKITKSTVSSDRGPGPVGSTSRGGQVAGKWRGGPVMAGGPYIVGEKGWEHFVPKVDGFIVNQSDAANAAARSMTPAAGIGGGGGFSMVVNNPVPEPVSRSAAKAREVAFLLGA